MEDRDESMKVKGEEPKLVRTRVRTRLSRRGLIVLGATALVVVALAAALIVPLVLTLQPSYYERYPSLAGRIAAWRSSTHSPFACADCHVDPGSAGLIAYAEKALPSFYSQLISGPTTENVLAVPSSSACLKCHTADRTISPNGDLLIPHPKHVGELGIACATCHKNLVHSLNGAGFNRPEMATCLVAGCHDGVKAKNECVSCHTQIQVPPDHKKPDWLTVHPTLVGTIDCAKCHAWTPNYCQTCHSQRPPSHVGNWKYGHQFAATARGEKGCLVCHDQTTWCDKCH